MMAPLLFWEFNTNSNWPFSALAFILMATTLLLTTWPTLSFHDGTMMNGPTRNKGGPIPTHIA